MIRTTLIFLLVTAFAWGCASAPKELVEARIAYNEAEQSQAAQMAPTEVREAKKALDRAERAFDKTGNDEVTRSLAYVAHRRAQQAMVVSELYVADREREQKRELLLTQNEQARKSLSSRLEEASEYARMNALQLKNERDRLESARSELEQARKKGELSEEELRAQQERLTVLSTKLAEERAAREAAQKNLADARAQLEKIANIKEEERRLTITLNGSVLFELDQSKLMTIAETRLDQVAEVLLAERNAEIVVHGHTDSQGKEGYNKELSQRRAESVANYLVTKGIAQDRIKAVGKGESEPVASNKTPEGRANNRRVEIIVDRQPEQASLQQKQQQANR